MQPEERIDELLLLWEERRDEGQQVSPEELCQNCPELIVELRQKIEALQSMRNWLEGDELHRTVGFSASVASWADSTRHLDAGGKRKLPALEQVHVPGYEILKLLGRGGMGVVYQARDVKLDRVVALKMILGGGHASESDLNRFQTEARAIAQLQHPHIVQVFEVGEHEGKPYFSLEYCSGGNLDRKLGGTPLRPREAARLIETLAQTMHYAHQRQLIHRDLKPANILLLETPESAVVQVDTTVSAKGRGTVQDSATGQSASKASGPQHLRPDLFPKISDFGLAKKLDQEAGQTHSGAVMGTPSYMAPEQATGKVSEIGPACDIYALGAILYECLTGRPPFKAATAMDTMAQVTNDDPVPPRRLQPTTPRDLETICLKCLQKDPKKRYSSALNLAEDLHRFLEGRPILARPVSMVERAWRWCHRNPRVAALATVLLFVLIAGSVTLFGLYALAESRRVQAESDANQALVSQRRAEEAQTIAETAKKKAEDAQGIAESAKQRAEDASKQATAEAAKAREFSDLLLSVFESADPMGLQGYTSGTSQVGSSQLTAKEILDRAVAKIKKIKGQPEIQAAQMDSIGNIYRSLGLHKQAKELLEEGYALRLKVLGEQHAQTADSLYHLGWLYHEQGKYPDARKLYEKSLQIRQMVLGEDDPKVTAAKFNLAWLMSEMGQHDESEVLFTEVIKRRLSQHGSELHRDVAVAKIGLAAMYLEKGQFLKAVPPATEAMGILRKISPNDKLAEAVNLFQQGVATSLGLGQHFLAEAPLRKCVKLVQEELGDNHPYLAIATFQLGHVLESQKKYKEAEKYFRQSLQICRNSVGLGHPKAALVVSGVARILAKNGQFEEGNRLFEEALNAHKERFGEDHPLVADMMVAHAVFLGKRSAHQEQLTILARAMKIYEHSEAKYGMKAPRFKEALRIMIALCWKTGSADKGLEVALLRQKLYPNQPQELFEAAADMALMASAAHKNTSTDEGKRKELEAECVQQALATLEKATASGFKDAVLLKTDPRLNPLLERSEYLALFGKLPTVDWSKITIWRGQLTKADPFDAVQKSSRHTVYQVPLEAGKTYQIDLLSAELDPFLRIEDAAKTQLGLNDDVSDESLNSRLEFTPPQSGTYRIIVTTYVSGQIGNFVLTVREKS